MEDGVAEVLAQRSALDNGFAAGLIVSLLFHGGMSAAAVYAALHQPRVTVAPILNIRFAPVAPRVVAAPKPATPRIEPPKPEPIKPVETKKAPEKNAVPLSPFGRSSKKGSENPVAPPQPPATVPPRHAAPSVVAVLEGGDFPYTLYIDRMTTLIGSRFFRPQVVAAGATVVVHFVIDRDGTIRDATMKAPSGNGTFDRSALRAVLESSPLPPLPFGYSGTWLGVDLTFR